MKFFRIKLGVSGEVDQQTLLAKIRGAGGDGIQTSDGLYIASPMGESELMKCLAAGEEVSKAGFSFSPDGGEMTPDMKNFRSKF